MNFNSPIYIYLTPGRPRMIQCLVFCLTIHAYIFVLQTDGSILKQNLLNNLSKYKEQY